MKKYEVTVSYPQSVMNELTVIVSANSKKEIPSIIEKESWDKIVSDELVLETLEDMSQEQNNYNFMLTTLYTLKDWIEHPKHGQTITIKDIKKQIDECLENVIKKNCENYYDITLIEKV
jgi:hypothetical protein